MVTDRLFLVPDKNINKGEKIVKPLFVAPFQTLINLSQKLAYAIT